MQKFTSHALYHTCKAYSLKFEADAAPPPESDKIPMQLVPFIIKFPIEL